MTLWSGPALHHDARATLPSLLRTAARAHPHGPALVDAADGRTLGFAALAAEVARSATVLADEGVGFGDRVLLLMPNGIDFCATALAAQALGAAVSGINPQAPAAEIARQFAPLCARLLVADSSSRETTSAAATVLGVGTLDTETLAARASAVAAATASCTLPEPDAPAFLPYSSGTTGAPKAVIVRQRELVAAAEATGTALELVAEDRLLGAAPMYHVVGPLLLALALVRRVPLVLVARPEPAALFGAIERHRVSVAPVVPPLLKVLAWHPEGDGRDLSSLRLVACGGNLVPEPLQRRAAERSGAAVIQVFGMTETVGALLFDDPRDPRPGTAGRPAPGTSIRVVDPESGAALGVGETGELQGRGSMLASGYLDDPGADRELWTADGWLRTGDLAEFDGDGRVRIRGRLKELIKVHAAQVAPAELETLLAAHPAVADAAVIGRPNRHCGEIPVAYVVWKSPCDPFEALEWLNEQLLPYKRVRAIEPIDTIPRSAVGKVLRRELLAEDVRRGWGASRNERESTNVTRVVEALE